MFLEKTIGEMLQGDGQMLNVFRARSAHESHNSTGRILDRPFLPHRDNANLSEARSGKRLHGFDL